ncbi:hypothetical protein Y032_0195g1466 [Ancylostoma ceylanicum]|uniref:Uncharacterized protein n=1 Tax=Ancylostoma ceylanicum TaxID=53326 RepID=A0A016SNU8_9BILA|nr:hypothetical protein Y032_0195g1466 [Ancylostoma ceylanicum]
MRVLTYPAARLVVPPPPLTTNVNTRPADGDAKFLLGAIVFCVELKPQLCISCKPVLPELERILLFPCFVAGLRLNPSFPLRHR